MPLPDGIELEELKKFVPADLWDSQPHLALYHALKRSNLFDEEDYLNEYPDVKTSNMDPIYHYVNYGVKENRLFSCKNTPKVSIIISVYNNCQYLHECFDSIIHQTLQKIQIIIINDGSTDLESVKIMNEYASQDKRITIIHKNNTGYGHSMNIGLSIATGEYIGILESDDYLEKDMYAELYKIARQHSCDIVKSDIKPFWGDREKRKFNNIEITEKNYYGTILNPKNNIQAFNANGYIAIQTAIYNNKFLKRNNIKFSETPGASFQDIGFYFRTAVLSEKFYFLNKSFYCLRRDNEYSSVKDCTKVYSVCFEYDSLKEFININHIKSEFKNLYCKKKFLSYLWNYERLKDTIKHEFLNKFYQDFLEDKQDNYFDLSLFNQTEINKLKTLGIYKNNRLNINKISIIIACYNSESTIEETLNSLCLQSFKNFELIIVDDGSTDKTKSILNKYEHNDKRIKIMYKQHTNAGDSRNIGYQTCTGKYVIFLDSDDLFQTDMLEKAYNEIEKYNADICVFRCKIYNDQKKELTNIVFPGSFYRKEIPNHRPLSNLDLQQGLFHYFQTAAWNKMFSHKFIEHNKLKFQSMRNANDMYFVNVALLKARSIVTIDDPLVYYRKNNLKSLTNTKDKSPECVYIALKAIYEEMRNINFLYYFERDFLNYVIKTLLWDYKSLKINEQKIFIELFRKKYKNIFMIHDKTKGFFYNTEQYKQFISIFY